MAIVFQSMMFITLLLASAFFSLAHGIKDAPRRTTQRESEGKTATAGDDIKLTCPIDGTPTPIYEWFKNDELIPEEGWERMRLQGRTLRIKEVAVTDQGSYICTAVNGFGKVTFTTHLTVIDPMSTFFSSSSLPGGLPPEFTQLLPPVPGKVEKPVGHNIKIQCMVSGVPEPTVTWFKDGVELREGSLGGESCLTRHYLHLMDLRPRDSGTYTCAAANALGAVFTNWTVTVIDEAMPREPEFYPHDPANTTVVAGEPATLQCRGNSEVAPHIKWLRRLEDGSSEADHTPENETLNWKGHRYVVLQATQVLTPDDGSFYTKLVIPKVSVRDSGVYVCTATTNFGLSYRQARLSVIGDTSYSNAYMLIVSLGCVGGVLLVVLAVIRVRRAQSSKPPPPPGGPCESILLPPPLINKGKGKPPHHARYVAQRVVQSSQQQQRAPPCHAVAPEGGLLQFAGDVVHLRPPHQSTTVVGSQPIIEYLDPVSSPSAVVAQQPPLLSTASTGRLQYQYQHLVVV